MPTWELALPAAWLLATAWSDFRQRRVPNWLVALGGLTALALLAASAQPFGIDWAGALLAGAVAFAFLLGFYVLRVMGAGDVKFAGALGLWVGTQALLPIWIGASLMAAVHAGVLLMQPGVASAGSGTARRRQIPYAGYMALTALGWMAWMASQR